MEHTNSLGLMLQSTGDDQKSIFSMSMLNNVAKMDKYYDTVLFYLWFNQTIMNQKFAMMDAVELYGFSGNVIASDLDTADILIKSIGPAKKFFYVWDLEWTMKKFDYDYLANIYQNPNIELIARSDDHYKLLAKTWREPITVIENLNYEEVIRTVFS